MSVEIGAGELRHGDQIGPADVTQPINWTVIGIRPRTSAERQEAMVAVRVQAESDGQITTRRQLVSDTVYVRRYFVTVTVTRAGGAVDARKPKMWLRPVDDVATLLEAWRLKLQVGDSVSFVAA